MDDDYESARAMVQGARNALIDNYDVTRVERVIDLLNASLQEEPEAAFVLLWASIHIAARAVAAVDLYSSHAEHCMTLAIGGLINETLIQKHVFDNVIKITQ